METAKKIAKPKKGKCRFCKAELKHTFVDLGMSPLCEDFLSESEIKEMEAYYPLHAYVCSECFLVQLEEFATPQEIYKEYYYFSSYSDTWLKHSKKYASMAKERYNLNTDSLVVELASNDGYLLQYFMDENIPVLGIEPSPQVARQAIDKGVPTEMKFFGGKTVGPIVEKYGQADLIIGNNVLAHVPNINDFVDSTKRLLKPNGVINMEFPLLLNLIKGNQFDTIYHEHFSYLSFTTVDKIFKSHGLTLFDVDALKTHGGSIRIYARHSENEHIPIESSVYYLKQKEYEKGTTQLGYYRAFEENVRETKRKILDFMIKVKREGKSIVGYGAPGKGNTLLNYCGIGTDFIDYTVDRNEHKHGKYLPGSLIPIYHPQKIKQTKPDYVFILPWNLKNEIMDSLSYISDWGGKFVIPIPELKVYMPEASALQEY
jgi:SAM-dependent methyltransferase